MANGQQIREELEKWGLIRLLGAATGGAASYITDTLRLQGTAWAATAFDGCYVRITSGSGAPEDEQRKVDYLDMDNGQLYVTSDFSSAVASADTYEIWRKGIDPDDVDRARDGALTRLCSTWAFQPLSWVPNADFEDAVGADNWQASSGNITIAIQTLSFPYEHWRNAILGTNTVANEYIESASMYVRPSEHFYLFVPVSVRVGTAQILVRDITNGANIELSGTDLTTTLRGWTAFEVTGQVPSGCGEITIRLIGQESNATIEWGPVNFHWDSNYRLQLPARIVSRKHVGGVHYLETHTRVGGSVHLGVERTVEVASVDMRQVRNAVVAEFDHDHPMVHWPYFFEERIYYDALSTAYLSVANRTTGDAAITECPLDYVAAGTVKLLAEQYLQKQPEEAEFWQRSMAIAEEYLRRYEREFGPEAKPQQERERTIHIHQLRL
jgi:hypothetical protein